MLKGISPRSEEGGQAAVRRCGSGRECGRPVQAEAVGDPLAVARLQTILGGTLREAGATRIEVLERADHPGAELGADDPETTTLNNLAVAYQAPGGRRIIPLLGRSENPR